MMEVIPLNCNKNSNFFIAFYYRLSLQSLNENVVIYYTNITTKTTIALINPCHLCIRF